MAITFRGKVNILGHAIISDQAMAVIPVDSINAGENQVVLCSSMVVLDGSVVGGANNTFLWEQTSGSPVTIDDPTSLITFFLNVGGDDVSFRLYADKGTPYEMYDDLNVIRTPTTWSNTVYSDGVPVQDAFNYGVPNWKYYADERDITDLDFNPALPSWPPPGDADDGLGCPDISVTDPALVVSWNLPVDNYSVGSQTYIDFYLARFESALVEKYNTTSMLWELQIEIPGEGGIREYEIEYDETYRIGAKYDYGLSPVHIQYTDSFLIPFTGNDLYKTIWTNNRTVTTGFGLNGTVGRFTAETIEEEFNASFVTTEFGLSGTVGRFTAEIVVEEMNTTTVTSGLGVGSFDIARSDGDSIGG